MANTGFIEGKQNKTAFRMLEAWCGRAGATWRGGVGIGGGTMLRAVGMVYPILFTVLLLQMALSIFIDGYIQADILRLFAIQLASWLFLYSGIIYCVSRLSCAIRRSRDFRTLYTRVMVPSFIFIAVADVFMVLASLFHGKFLLLLLGKDTPEKVNKRD